MHRLWRVVVAMGVLAGVFATPAWSQSYTVAPYPPQYFTNTGAVCNGCKLNAYLTGTTTRRDTYSDTSGTANANPITLSSSGRATVYLAVGVSYRLVLTDSTGGTTYFDVDPITAVPASAGNIDVSATAGAAISAGDAVYLSDGSGSLTAGRWYQADADNTYSSSTAGLVGFATAAIASGGTGAVRIAGRMTALSGLTTGEFYYISATAGALTATPPTNQRFMGEADSTSTLVMNRDAGAVKMPDSAGAYTLSLITTSTLSADRRITILPGDSNRQVTFSGDLNVSGHATINQNVSTTGNPTFNALTVATVDTGQGANELYGMDQNVLTTSSPSFNQFHPPQGRCTLTTATPVTTANVTAATTLYYALYGGNQITLYDGSTRWVQMAFTQLSIAVPATTNTMYDVFVDYTAGTPALEVVAWTNDTTRATALATQNGVYVQTSDTDSLYVCSFRTTGVSGQTEDSYTYRGVWNYYNRVGRPMRRLESTDSWTYTTATIRQANGSTANQVAFVVGVAEEGFSAQVLVASENTGAGPSPAVGIGLDSTTAFATGSLLPPARNLVVSIQMTYAAFLDTIPAEGYHFAAWLEYSTASGTTTWYGDGGNPTFQQSGISGFIMG